MRTRNKLVLINVLEAILFILPAFKLDLFKENYSTLSLNTRGYLYVLFLGISIGLLFSYETKIIKNKKNAILIFLSLLVGTIIPHHVPYNLQGNLHLLFAYIGFIGLASLSIINIFYNKKLLSFYLLSLSFAVLIYMDSGMVNTLSEVIVMLSSMIVNLIMSIKK